MRNQMRNCADEPACDIDKAAGITAIRSLAEADQCLCPCIRFKCECLDERPARVVILRVQRIERRRAVAG